MDSGILKQLRLGLIHNVKLVSYIMEGYDAELLEAIREAFEKRWISHRNWISGCEVSVSGKSPKYELAYRKAYQD